MNVLADLQWRGLVADCTDLDALAARLAAGPLTLYCGFDPTADSLHVGNLVPLLALRRFQLAGHCPVALAGGATGMVGDPSGKSAERNLQTPEQVAHNIAAIQGQLARFLDFDVAANPARLVNNADWTAGVTYLEFLRDVGKHFTVNMMVAKESVRARMEDREVGISYTEFSYMLLQAFDFYVLRRDLGCELQVGATDQWGNLTAGTDLIRKKLGATAWGLTFPLLTKADGSKYGKTATGTVWLDPQRTSPYRFYQFFVQTDDRDVVKLLKVLTFLPPDEITALEAELAANPGARAAHKTLAKAVTDLVHGEAATQEAIRVSDKFFSGNVCELSANELADVIASMGNGGATITQATFEGPGIAAADLLVKAALTSSRGEARRLIEGGGIYLNERKQSDWQARLGKESLLHGRYLILRKGKHTYWPVTVV